MKCKKESMQLFSLKGRFCLCGRGKEKNENSKVIDKAKKVYEYQKAAENSVNL